MNRNGILKLSLILMINQHVFAQLCELNLVPIYAHVSQKHLWVYIASSSKLNGWIQRKIDMDLPIPLKIYSSIVYHIKLPKVLKLSQFSRQIPFLAVKNIIIYLLQKSSEILQIYYKDPHSRDSLRVLRLRWIELFVPRPSCLGLQSVWPVIYA